MSFTGSLTTRAEGRQITKKKGITVMGATHAVEYCQETFRKQVQVQRPKNPPFPVDNEICMKLSSEATSPWHYS